MDGLGAAVWTVDIVSRETMLFAAVGFAVGGIDDLAIDLVYLFHILLRRVRRGGAPEVLADFPIAAEPGRLAIFIAAWDESAVIGQMLATALDRFDHPDYRLYVGTYPNDRPTIDVVSAIAARDARVRLVIGPDDGPTTKADCLNAVWRALRADEAAGARWAKAIILHDAEDMVHAGELRVFDALIGRHWVVQLPVHPLVVPGSRYVSGHYCDEFSEAHGKTLVVRQALGAGLPLAGVGCAIARDVIERIAAQRGGAPFDAASLTEDYELGLQIAAMGGTGVLARVFERAGGPLVAVRAYFPATLDAAVRQKARWMTGIALAGWDRVGWGRVLDWREHWMRMRDRRAPISVVVLAIAYVALVTWGVSMAIHTLFGGDGLPVTPLMRLLLKINAAMLLWRLGMRAVFTGRAYGLLDAACSVPRAFVGNLVALLAARRAILRYVGMLRGAAPRWDKTAHVFPEDAPGKGPA